jgi:CHAD domain-containing protein
MMRTLARPGHLARRSVNALAQQWPLALVDDIEGIHQARVASRRLRELVPVVARDPREGQALTLRRGLRAVTRLLGPSRELDVAGLTLAALEARAPAHARAIAIMRSRVAEERAKAAVAMHRAVAGVDIGRLAARTLACSAHLNSARAIRASAARAAARLDRRARALEAAVRGAGFVFAPGPLHGVRIALKKFRYSLEVVERFGRFRLRGSMQQLKQLQDLLGDLHDLQVLAGRVRDAIALAVAGTRPVLAPFVSEIDDEIRLLHSRFVTDRGGLVRVLARSARVCDVLVSLPAPGRSRAHRARGRAGGRLRENRPWPRVPST